jgi:hypothetical protein
VPLPLHLPSCPQLAFPWSVHAPTGSAPPFGTLVQVPSLPATAQLWHDMQALTPQQKPSVQCVLPHWLSLVQAWPLMSSGWQEPPGPVQ